MSIIDEIYRMLSEDFDMKEMLATTEWDKPAIYDGFRPPDLLPDVRIPYICYQYDVQGIAPWPMEQYSIEFDIWDMNDGNDTTLVRKIADRVKLLLDHTEVSDEYNFPSTLRNSVDLWLQDVEGIIHRKLVFTAKVLNYGILIR